MNTMAIGAMKIVAALQKALEAADIEFIGTPEDGPGVRIRTSPPKP